MVKLLNFEFEFFGRDLTIPQVDLISAVSARVVSGISSRNVARLAYSQKCSAFCRLGKILRIKTRAFCVEIGLTVFTAGNSKKPNSSSLKPKLELARAPQRAFFGSPDNVAPSVLRLVAEAGQLGLWFSQASAFMRGVVDLPAVSRRVKGQVLEKAIYP